MAAGDECERRRELDAGMPAFKWEAGCGAEPLQDPVDGGVRGAVHPGPVGEVGQPARFGPHVWDREPVAIVCQVAVDQAVWYLWGGVEVVFLNDDVDGAGMQGRECRLRIELDDADGDRRMCTGQSVQRRSDEVTYRGRKGGDGDVAGRVAAQRGDVGLDVGEDLGQAGGVRGDPGPGDREGERALPAAPGSVDEHEPGLAFERCQVGRDAGRGQMQRTCRGQHAPLGCHGAEDEQPVR